MTSDQYSCKFYLDWKNVLFQKFSQYLKVSGDSTALVRILEKIEGHLRENGTRFISGDSLARADCYLLPSLQHIRVAGKVWYSVRGLFHK